MHLVMITAFGVGMATVIGAIIGFLVKNIPHKFEDTILGFAAGIMLCASILGLILPSIEEGNNILLTSLGIIAGALFLSLIDFFTPHIHSMAGLKENDVVDIKNLSNVFLFVLAIAIHNFPEGMAAGVSFGTGDISKAYSVAIGIALQNIPEGMIIISPLLLAGISTKKTFIIALVTGLVEVIGTFIGYFAASFSMVLLPFILAFAGGTMIYVISDEMIPETHSHGYEKLATYALIFGFVVMLCLDYFI